MHVRTLLRRSVVKVRLIARLLPGSATCMNCLLPTVLLRPNVGHPVWKSLDRRISFCRRRLTRVRVANPDILVRVWLCLACSPRTRPIVLIASFALDVLRLHRELLLKQWLTSVRRLDVPMLNRPVTPLSTGRNVVSARVPSLVLPSSFWITSRMLVLHRSPHPAPVLRYFVVLLRAVARPLFPVVGAPIRVLGSLSFVD